jgi:hypothetical protein
MRAILTAAGVDGVELSRFAKGLWCPRIVGPRFEGPLQSRSELRLVEGLAKPRRGAVALWKVRGGIPGGQDEGDPRVLKNRWQSWGLTGATN